MAQLPTDCWYQRVRYKCNILNGGTKLHVAAKHGDCPVIQQDLDNDAEISAQDYSGKSPLHYAVAYRRTAAAQLLLDAGADPAVKDNDNKMPVAYSWETGLRMNQRTGISYVRVS
jgi:ankyrin repeat protein